MSIIMWEQSEKFLIVSLQRINKTECLQPRELRYLAKNWQNHKNLRHLRSRKHHINYQFKIVN